MGWRIGALAKRHGLSRSTLLYYDRIGLLKPGGRSANGYRVYGDQDDLRLGRIVAYRRTGASMADIGRMLDGGPTGLRRALDARLAQLSDEIADLREQQWFILRLLRTRGARARTGPISLAVWVKLLRASGLGRAEMNRWHRAFERTTPTGHRAFLQFLGLSDAEIARIRSLSRGEQVAPRARESPPAERRGASSSRRRRSAADPQLPARVRDRHASVDLPQRQHEARLPALKPRAG